MQCYVGVLKDALLQHATIEKAQASQRFFTHEVSCMGVNAADIKKVVSEFHMAHKGLCANEVLAITEALLAQAHYNEEVLTAFGLINKYVKRHYDDNLLARFEYWLEHYTTNWSTVDDLCIKTIFLFLLSRPHLIEKTRHWRHSEVSWCRRASNVVWVKFIYRPIANAVYRLDKNLIFDHCDVLLDDPDEFVQKSLGWLLKVTAAHHHDAVVEYIEHNSEQLQRVTLRYAIEKMAPTVRKRLLAL